MLFFNYKTLGDCKNRSNAHIADGDRARVSDCKTQFYNRLIKLPKEIRK